jgi:hypothetical protein
MGEGDLSNNSSPDTLSLELREIKSLFEELEKNRSDTKGKGKLSQLLGYLSNGFVLLIIGSIITTNLVPHFQTQFETKKENRMLMHESFSQFLLYSNSAWEEYYAVFPLIHKTDMTLEEYNNYYAVISKIKLKRYDAYAKLKALSLAFREDDINKSSDIEKEIESYAVKVNDASLYIDDWARNLYCSPNKCANVEPDPVNSDFNSIEVFSNVKNKVEALQAYSDTIASNMIRHISSLD